MSSNEWHSLYEKEHMLLIWRFKDIVILLSINLSIFWKYLVFLWRKLCIFIWWIYFDGLTVLTAFLIFLLELLCVVYEHDVCPCFILYWVIERTVRTVKLSIDIFIGNKMSTNNWGCVFASFHILSIGASKTPSLYSIKTIVTKHKSI